MIGGWIMKKCFAVLLVLLSLFLTVASAEGMLTVTQKNLIEFEGKDTGYFFAKVENTGDAPIGVGKGKLVAFSKNDEILVTKDYIYSFPSYTILQPGEYVYVQTFIWENILETKDISDYKFSIEAEKVTEKTQRIPAKITLDTGNKYDNYAYITFTNTTDQILEESSVSFGMYDAAGKFLYAEGISNNTVGIHPGSTVTVKIYIRSDILDYFAAKGMTPTQTDAVVIANIK